MTALALLVLLLSCLTLSTLGTPLFRAPNCRKCSSLQECLTLPEKDTNENGECKFKGYDDPCGFSNCFKGPGDRCSANKRCAPGLICLCETCQGCVDIVNKGKEGLLCYSPESACPSQGYDSY